MQHLTAERPPTIRRHPDLSAGRVVLQTWNPTERLHEIHRHWLAVGRWRVSMKAAALHLEDRRTGSPFPFLRRDGQDFASVESRRADAQTVRVTKARRD